MLRGLWAVLKASLGIWIVVGPIIVFDVIFDVIYVIVAGPLIFDVIYFIVAGPLI